MFAVRICEGQSSSLVSSWSWSSWSPKFKHLFTLCVCMHMCAYVRVHMLMHAFHDCLFWRSEDNFWESVLYFYHMGSKDRAQVVKREPLPPPPRHLTGPPHFPFWDRIHLFVPTPPQPCMLRRQVGATVSNFHVGARDCVQALHFTHWAISTAPGLTLKIPRLIYLIWSICHFPGICLNRNNRWKEQRWKTWGRQPKKSVWRWKVNLQNYVAYTYIGRNNWSCRVNWG